MADSGHPPAELHERLLICRTIKLNAGAHGGHRRCCHAQMQKNAQNKPQIARFILCVHTTLQVCCNLFLTFCQVPRDQQIGGFAVALDAGFLREGLQIGVVDLLRCVLHLALILLVVRVCRADVGEDTV